MRRLHLALLMLAACCAVAAAAAAKADGTSAKPKVPAPKPKPKAARAPKKEDNKPVADKKEQPPKAKPAAIVEQAPAAEVEQAPPAKDKGKGGNEKPGAAQDKGKGGNKKAAEAQDKHGGGNKKASAAQDKGKGGGKQPKPGAANKPGTTHAASSQATAAVLAKPPSPPPAPQQPGAAGCLLGGAGWLHAHPCAAAACPPAGTGARCNITAVAPPLRLPRPHLCSAPLDLPAARLLHFFQPPVCGAEPRGAVGQTTYELLNTLTFNKSSNGCPVKATMFTPYQGTGARRACCLCGPYGIFFREGWTPRPLLACWPAEWGHQLLGAADACPTRLHPLCHQIVQTASWWASCGGPDSRLQTTHTTSRRM